MTNKEPLKWPYGLARLNYEVPESIKQAQLGLTMNDKINEILKLYDDALNSRDKAVDDARRGFNLEQKRLHERLNKQSPIKVGDTIQIIGGLNNNYGKEMIVEHLQLVRRVGGPMVRLDGHLIGANGKLNKRKTDVLIQHVQLIKKGERHE